jgi:DNA sulfur modification protein DndC
VNLDIPIVIQNASDESFKAHVRELVDDIKEVYQLDSAPWIIGYSGGKDSTATLQLVWMAISELEPQQRTKPVHVISTDTLVENPVVAAWVRGSLKMIASAANDQELPITPHQLTPKTEDSFWVNLLGKGYPSPRNKFRWCTDRLKISPSNKFITGLVSRSGEAVLVLGSRKAESTARARNMKKHEKGRTRDRLSPNSRLPNCLVYTPIETWQGKDVWKFLVDVLNPWGYDNRDLFDMYLGATDDSECPMVVDDTTKSCGDSRFGCWVCTMVEKDKSMMAMIKNDEEKQWMKPLLDFRDEIGVRPDKDRRDFRRLNGSVQLFHGEPIPGPYRKDIRELWLERLLKCQVDIQRSGPDSVADLQLISLVELEEIRRIWVQEKHEIEDTLPSIYERATSEEYPGKNLNNVTTLGSEELAILRERCGGDELHYQLLRELLDVEQRYRSLSRRAGLFEDIEKVFKRNFFTDAEDAKNRALSIQEAKDANQNRIDNRNNGATTDPYIQQVDLLVDKLLNVGADDL